MKLEKRTADTKHSAQVSHQKPVKKERTHILGYILILFIAAFFLMALSFLSHQRSNEQVLGQLSSTANTLESLQTALEENTRLEKENDSQQKQIDDLQAQLAKLEMQLQTTAGEKDSLEKQLQSAKDQLQAAIDSHAADAAYRQKQLDAMTNLYLLQNAFQAKEYDRCREMIAKMEEYGQVELLIIPGAALDNPSPGIIINGMYNSPHLIFESIKRTLEGIPTENTPAAN